MNAISAPTSASRWAERHAEVCRRHHNLIGVWESPDSECALLLRETLVPLRYEHRAWLHHTRATAREIIRDLKAAGLVARRFVVLQWWPLDRIAEVFETWSCRYDADPVRREQHARFVATEMADRRFLFAQWMHRTSAPDRVRLDLSKPIG